MFLLFAGDHYYPGGGWRDYRGMFPTLEAAIAAGAWAIAAGAGYDWYHVVSGAVIVHEGRSGYYDTRREGE